jgi:hypothetical protein
MGGRPPYALSHKAAGAAQHGAGRAAGGLLLRGVVLAVYKADDPRLVARMGARTPNGIVCDVMIVDPRYRTVYKNVPIVTASGGVDDLTIYEPRASSIDLNTGGVLTPSAEGVPGVPVTSAEDMDGDWVLVGFLANDLNQPVILGSMTHPRVQVARKASIADVPAWKTRRIIRGWSIGVKKDGNAHVDASAATAGVIIPGATGLNTETPAVPVAGNLTVKMAPGTVTTIEDSVASAPKRVILGETFLTQLAASLTEISSVMTAFGFPTTQTSALIANINTSLSAQGLPLLSLHLKVD